MERKMKHQVWILGLFACAACSGSDNLAPNAEQAKLTYQASPVTFDASHGMFESTVTIRNPTADTIPLDVGACPLTFQFYRDSARSGTPVFDSGINQACILSLFVGVIPPGGSSVYNGGVGKNTVLDAIDTAGTYYVTVVFEGAVKLDGGRIELPPK
jgi:hypothetical protein